MNGVLVETATEEDSDFEDFAAKPKPNLEDAVEMFSTAVKATLRDENQQAPVAYQTGRLQETEIDKVWYIMNLVSGPLGSSGFDHLSGHTMISGCIAAIFSTMSQA